MYEAPREGADIVVIGGGIGGIAAAAFLRRVGRRVRVYEQAREFGAVGAGLVVSPNAVRLIRRLGVLPVLERMAVPLQAAWEFRRWSDGTVLFSQELGTQCRELYGEDYLVAHRADLLAALLAAIDPETVVLGKRCTGIEQRGDTVDVRFDDGTSTTAAVVIGADGIHSVVASAVTTATEPEFTRLCAYRCLVPADKAPEFARQPVHTLWLGPGRHVIHYPISGGALVNLVAIVPETEWLVESWSAEGRIEDLRSEFTQWDPRLGSIIAEAPSVGRWALFNREPLPMWVEGSIALLGDAAHPMLPFLGQGAAQTIEDAAALALCLADRDAGLAEGLRAYQDARIERATSVQLRSNGRKDVNHLPDGPEQRARDASFAAANPLRHNEWLYAHDVEKAVTEIDRSSGL
ncbi:FAD-dependent monooxygenase [Pseudonocardia xinjiangensis]|uniref:NAD(P)-binding protein n=1 Tax=Pseudonocardia xinjiangensis TaxID=75289 RepID=A0ABX1R5I4_9PSEU|nr:FAD-dependent monooxygenase [Pseudonocardia xinjiangensis]NMH75660.1 NAD(P)-binding protein [Pseudonocardia xinjiangensis]